MMAIETTQQDQSGEDVDDCDYEPEDNCDDYDDALILEVLLGLDILDI